MSPLLLLLSLASLATSEVLVVEKLLASDPGSSEPPRSEHFEFYLPSESLNQEKLREILGRGGGGVRAEGGEDEDEDAWGRSPKQLIGAR